MPSEEFTVCALPHSCATGADFHVSLFIAPRLTPDEPEDELSRFALFPRWGGLVADETTTFALFDQSGQIEAEPRLGAIDPDVWVAVFPPDTPVRGQPLPEWQNRRWRTFRAAHVHDMGKVAHATSMFADPTTPPAPSAHPLTPLVAGVTSQFYIEQSGRSGPPMVYDESLGTRVFDELVESDERLEFIDRMIAGERNPMRRIMLELHRVRRFYERPESELEYRERPVRGLKSPRPPRPEPDFHERCALAGDHPALLRKLGLVIDVRVADPSRLRNSVWLSAHIGPGGQTAACRVTRTACTAVGDDLLTVPRTPDWQQGLLRLGDADRFALLDMDADGTALKLERYLWTLPRLLEIEENGDPVNAATPAQRSSGFTLVRHTQANDVQASLVRQKSLLSELATDQPLLNAEDLARGMRVEVWDDTAERWFSLHSRLVDVEVAGGTVLDDVLEEGFVQGTPASETTGVPNSPVHVHEAVFGWEGWSLSAPRPGKRVRHENGKEIVEDPDTDPDPVTPVVITTKVAPGTLPRLRFGRWYAFRSWFVDLAGNVRPHLLNPPPVDPALVGPALAARIASPDREPAVFPPATAELRAQTHAVLEARRLSAAGADGPRRGLQALDVGDASVGPEVLGRLRQRQAARPAAGAGESVPRQALVAQVFARALGDPHEPFVASTVAFRAPELTPVVAGSLPQLHGIAAGLDLDALLGTITPLRPFLRWDPVPSPSIVPRHRFTEAESVRVLVIRSGVTQDPDTLALAVTPPDDYAVASNALIADLGYRATSERHLAPPKTSQLQAELHGNFDAAIGSSDALARQRMLAVALREAGTFFDLAVVSLADPTQTIPQPGVRLETAPGPPQAPPKSLPLKAGDPPAPGQYVVHDTDQLVLPYLPDPMARGVSLAFPEAGLDRSIPFPFGGEGFTAVYTGDWPELEPFRFVLAGATELSGRLEDNVITVELPPGDQQRFRLASSLRRADLDRLGPWRSLPAAVRADPDVTEAAVDGWLWGLTPHEEVLLVHAVPRPLEAPRATTLTPSRVQGSTAVTLIGAVDVHGPSTDSLTAEAAWVEPVDDVTLEGCEDHSQAAVAFTTPVLPFEDLAVLGPGDFDFFVENFGRIRGHRAVHQFGDTKHRVVDYTFRASTRFREYFRPELLTPVPGVPGDDGRSVVGPVVQVSVPSTARPAAPIVHSVLPLFRWSDGTEPEQPFARRRSRRAGVRIYLERPWFSSGEGELLAVLLAPSGNDSFGPPAPDQSGFPFVSKWGADPVWLGAPVTPRAMGPMLLDNLLSGLGVGYDDRPHPARPVTPARELPLASLPQRPTVVAVGYAPQYNAERRLWYVDVAIDPGEVFWPFVRLAVARYQPDSLPDSHLSAPVRCDFIQLTPVRTTSVSRTDDTHVRVVVSGPVGVRTDRFPTALDDLAAAVDSNRQVVARLQQRDPAIPTDLGWKTVAVAPLTVRGRGQGTPDFEVAWTGSLTSPVVIPLTRPGANPDWRVTVEEWERLPGDPANLPTAVLMPIWERRLVYADEVML